MVVTRLEIEFIGFGVVGWARLDCHALGWDKPDLERGNNGLGDLILKIEDVGHFAVEPLRPDRSPRCAIYKLGIDTNPIAGFAHAALDHMGQVHVLGCLRDIDGATLEGEGRVAGDNRQRRDLGEIGDHILGDPVSEILLIGIVRTVGKGEYKDFGEGGFAIGGLTGRGKRVLSYREYELVAPARYRCQRLGAEYLSQGRDLNGQIAFLNRDVRPDGVEYL